MEDLSRLSTLYPELHILKLSNNQIKSLEDVLTALVSCSKLESLDLTNNPCVGEDQEAYTKLVREKLPKLEVLDGFNREGQEVVSDDEEDEDDEDEEDEEDEEDDDEDGEDSEEGEDGEDDEEGEEEDEEEEEEEATAEKSAAGKKRLATPVEGKASGEKRRKEEVSS